ncbi:MULTISPECIES: ABC transporter ATP-binding protein [unclassified Leptolyngbya]|uniref:ABC transporter ATP-binding protein n=1 Tax=unclassified Leptolyngbya TaxID=2650499 RepID=UPI00168980A3|nr:MULTISPECIES: ABC transporter ATP-binding protein [unclassified Leptolyngbya]MBD1910732.1 ABC transporter ATP-binding protein [Leptolyngbya sp. FACHB-8]MBD2158167.1 ABC transporter ATP-binding protein [Leptolyngbya sp. FACHB-16]
MTASQVDPRVSQTLHPTGLRRPSGTEPHRPLAIVARNVGMVYQAGGEEFQALSHINLEVPEGSIQLLMGPSGSGKTTLLSILAGILTPSSGSVHLLGQEITHLSRHRLSQFRLHNIGFIFQGFNLFPALTALENVELAFQVKGINRRDAREQSLMLLDQVGLADKTRSFPKQLSGGQKQRVAIARALAGDPSLIMADEPTAALDSQSGHAVIELLRNLAKERDRTVLMVTHDSRIMDVADRVLHLEDGMLKAA